MKSSANMLKPVRVMMNVRNTREVTVKVKSGYVVQYVINDTMKAVMNNLHHLFLLLDYIERLHINRLYYLLVVCYIYG